MTHRPIRLHRFRPIELTRPTPGFHPASRSFFLLLSLLLLPSCASRSENPFLTGENSAKKGAGEHYRVRFEASCDVCSVDWSAASRTGGVQLTKGPWSHSETVFLWEGQTSMARVSVQAAPGANAVSWVRIRVDGEVVAESPGEDGRNKSGTGRAISAYTPLPPGEGGTGRRP